MNDITADMLELPYAIAPTDGETVAEILALGDLKEVTIQTEEDLGPKDSDLPSGDVTDLPTIH